MSNSYENNDTLAERYNVPLEIINPEIAEMLQIIDRFAQDDISRIPHKMETFQIDAMNILEEQLSTQNLTRLIPSLPYADHPLVAQIASTENIGNILEGGIADNAALKDAKSLFSKHVTSAFKETKDELLHGPALAKLGTSLSLPGRVLSGINSFWEELIEKRPALQILDTLIVKPLMVSACVQFLPEIAIIKGCELVGRACCAYAHAPKGHKWSAIKASAAEMIGITLKHADLLTGSSMPSKIIKMIEESGLLSSDVETTVKDIITSDQKLNILEKFTKNPAIAAAIIIGAVDSSKVLGIPLQGSMNIVETMLSSNIKDIKISALCQQEGMKQAAPLLTKVFGTSKGILPQSAKTFKFVLGAIQSCKKITEEQKVELVQAVVKCTQVEKVMGKPTVSRRI